MDEARRLDPSREVYLRRPNLESRRQKYRGVYFLWIGRAPKLGRSEMLRGDIGLDLGYSVKPAKNLR